MTASGFISEGVLYLFARAFFTSFGLALLFALCPGHLQLKFSDQYWPFPSKWRSCQIEGSILSCLSVAPDDVDLGVASKQLVRSIARSFRLPAVIERPLGHQSPSSGAAPHEHRPISQPGKAQLAKLQEHCRVKNGCTSRLDVKREEADLQRGGCGRPLQFAPSPAGRGRWARHLVNTPDAQPGTRFQQPSASGQSWRVPRLQGVTGPLAPHLRYFPHDGSGPPRVSMCHVSRFLRHELGSFTQPCRVRDVPYSVIPSSVPVGPAIMTNRRAHGYSISSLFNPTAQPPQRNAFRLLSWLPSEWRQRYPHSGQIRPMSCALQGRAPDRASDALRRGKPWPCRGYPVITPGLSSRRILHPEKRAPNLVLCPGEVAGVQRWKGVQRRIRTGVASLASLVPLDCTGHRPENACRTKEHRPVPALGSPLFRPTPVATPPSFPPFSGVAAAGQPQRSGAWCLAAAARCGAVIGQDPGHCV